MSECHGGVQSQEQSGGPPWFIHGTSWFPLCEYTTSLSISIHMYKSNGNGALSFSVYSYFPSEARQKKKKKFQHFSLYTFRSVCSPSQQTQNNWLEVQIRTGLCILVQNGVQLIRRINVPFKSSGDHLIQAQYQQNQWCWRGRQREREEKNQWLFVIPEYVLKQTRLTGSFALESSHLE